MSGTGKGGRAVSKRKSRKPAEPEGKKRVPLTGNNRTRREQFKALCKEHGDGKVKRVDNPEARCKGTVAEVDL